MGSSLVPLALDIQSAGFPGRRQGLAGVGRRGGDHGEGDGGGSDLVHPSPEPLSSWMKIILYYDLTLCVCVCESVAQSCLTLCHPKDSCDHLSPLSLEFSREEYWNGLPSPLSG